MFPNVIFGVWCFTKQLPPFCDVHFDLGVFLFLFFVFLSVALLLTESKDIQVLERTFFTGTKHTSPIALLNAVEREAFITGVV